MIDKYAELSRVVERELLVQRVPHAVLRVVLGIKQLTLQLDRDSAPVDRMEDFAAAICMEPRDCSAALRIAERMKLVRILRGGQRWWYELQTNPALWQPREMPRDSKDRRQGENSRRAVDAEALAAARRMWPHLEQCGADQPDLFPPNPSEHRDGGFAAYMAEANREAALAFGTGDTTGIARTVPNAPRSGDTTALSRPDENGEIPRLRGDEADPVIGKWGNSPFDVPQEGGNGEIPHREPNGEIPHLLTRAPASAGHVSSPTESMIHEHDHVRHAPGGGEERNAASLRSLRPVLTKPDQWELMGWINELVTDPVEQRKYETTWTLRILDHPILVFKAISETRVADREGRIKTTPGQFMNATFKIFRDGVKRAVRDPKAKTTKP